MGKSKNMNLGVLDSINKKKVSIDKNISTNSDSSDDVSINNDSNISENVSIDNDSNISGNVSSSNNRNNNGNINRNIVITKPIIQDKTKRASYYLKKSTIVSIEKLAKESGMGISEFLQYLLDITLDKIEIR